MVHFVSPKDESRPDFSWVYNAGAEVTDCERLLLWVNLMQIGVGYDVRAQGSWETTRFLPVCLA